MSFYTFWAPIFDRIEKALPFLKPKPLTGEMKPPELKRELRKGMTGDDVFYVQRRLKKQGYFDGTPAGNFGDLTYQAVVYFQQTHTGPDGKALWNDGVVGENTWWALHNASGVPQREYRPAVIPTGITGNRLKVLLKCVELHQEGIREIPDGSNTGDGVTKFHQWFGMPPSAWCAMSVSWVVYKAMGAMPWGSKQAHVATLWKIAKGKGLAHAHDPAHYRPVPGDLFVMVHKDGTGHIGILGRVSLDGKSGEVFEGNSGNRFAFRKRVFGEGDHVGWINIYGDANAHPTFQLGLSGTSGKPAGTR